MAITPSPVSGTSAVRNQFLDPLRLVYDQATTRRNCPAESDWDWLAKGADRVLANVRSGGDLFPVPAQSGDVSGPGTGAGH